METKIIYKPFYTNSWALIVGINDYKYVNPLEYASNDASIVADILENNYAFPKSNIKLLLDKDATRGNIVSSFLSFTNEKVKEDDRIFIFYAGHGHTQIGNRGEAGFLVPVDGKPDDLTTLIRWDEFTRNADLIRAKHMLFVMDACYGGLALTRFTSPGSMRFIKNMLQRFSRQVITSGKADEAVSDSGGPKSGHSIFTGYFLEALDGAAAPRDGFITANNVMAYVYDRVAKDHYSRQTPHYGFLDGDGDFIFNASKLEKLAITSEKDEDILVEIPATFQTPNVHEESSSDIDLIKEYLSDPRYKIKLDDLVTLEIRRVLQRIGDDNFPVNTDSVNPNEFAERLKSYETIISDLLNIIILISKWGDNIHLAIIEKLLARICDSFPTSGGKVVWVGLRWYPILLLLYAGGIASLSSNNYVSLARILMTRVHSRSSGDEPLEVIIPTIKEISEVQRTDIFKALPGHERNYVPKSEYVFKVLQPYLDDILFLGRSYESFFDAFEVYFALVYADLRHDKYGDIWGPPGRFGWKYKSRIKSYDPFMQIIKDADALRDDWPPLKVGMFHSSYERFKKISTGYEKLLKGLNWY